MVRPGKDADMRAVVVEPEVRVRRRWRNVRPGIRLSVYAVVFLALVGGIVAWLLNAGQTPEECYADRMAYAAEHGWSEDYLRNSITLNCGGSVQVEREMADGSVIQRTWQL